ncbi:hypothetical protein AVEN_273338-1 [Araneus ventricosus]|uniref:Uncharacterized protein n=1 Tax=Araneus ventricosus TaxID=182803 RepID=A0A4Y2IKC6_ARAVE|nr:hypothetical protein AVEN_273338-1 [Araneus ventricosus]
MAYRGVAVLKLNSPRLNFTKYFYTVHSLTVLSSKEGNTVSCEDATEHTVTEWLSCDTEANQLYADEEIISIVQNKPQDDSDLE